MLGYYKMSIIGTAHQAKKMVYARMPAMWLSLKMVGLLLQ